MNTVSPDNIAHDYSFFFYYLFETILFCFFLLSLRGEKDNILNYLLTPFNIQLPPVS